MSLYENTYSSIISTLATSIYNKINSNTKNFSSGNKFRTITSSPGKTNVTQTNGSSTVANVVTEETLGTSYTKPTAANINTDITTFVKNTLGFTDTHLSQKPDAADMLAFVFAINYYLENTLAKVVTAAANGSNTTTVVYKAITTGHTNRIDTKLSSNDLVANRASKDILDGIYNSLKNINDTANSGYALTVNAATTSSSSSSSCSSSCSSSSSSSSSSIFIAYFNLN